MNLQELQETDWYKERPRVIQQAIDITPPIILYKFKSSGKQCYIEGYEEPESGKLEDIRLRVVKTGIGGPMYDMGMGVLDEGMGVFGVSPEDLEPYEQTTTPDTQNSTQ
jgi:hypothetical protein